MKIKALILCSALAISSQSSAAKHNDTSDYFPDNKDGEMSTRRVIADRYTVPNGGTTPKAQLEDPSSSQSDATKKEGSCCRTKPAEVVAIIAVTAPMFAAVVIIEIIRGLIERAVAKNDRARQEERESKK